MFSQILKREQVRQILGFNPNETTFCGCRATIDASEYSYLPGGNVEESIGVREENNIFHSILDQVWLRI